MNIQENISLKQYNTFGIDVKAKRFVSVNSLAALQEVLAAEKDVFLISGGSNMLLTQDIDTLVVHINIKGIAILSETATEAEVKVQAGENWHEFVLWCIENDLGGLENLSLIPGNVGTCPIQNIGAYGVEVKDRITQVEALHIDSNKVRIFTNSECEFGYRNSIFKNELKGRYVLTAVSFKLSKGNHQLNTSYGAIEKEFAAKGITAPSIKDVSDAVISIRQSKLPDPKKIGNSGSFFKNPVIDITHFKTLQEAHPNIPSYPVSNTTIKVPAGWLIEQAGYKGKRYGEAGVHEKQALVLVNYENASGLEVYAIAQEIQRTISKKFGIDLEIEVNVI